MVLDPEDMTLIYEDFEKSLKIVLNFLTDIIEP